MLVLAYALFASLSPLYLAFFFLFFFFKQQTAYEMRISDWSSDVCSSDLPPVEGRLDRLHGAARADGTVDHPLAPQRRDHVARQQEGVLAERPQRQAAGQPAEARAAGLQQFQQPGEDRKSTR